MAAIPITMAMPTDTALLRLLQLTSPALPVGAYAYSQGLESAVEQGLVTDENSAGAWIAGVLIHTHAPVDIPALARLYDAWSEGDTRRLQYWNHWLYASREARELQAEDRHLGNALARLLTDQGMEEARDWCRARHCCFATLFALAAVGWAIPRHTAALGYAWAWAENQVTAATKLVPLGQSAAQRLLSGLMTPLHDTVRRGLDLEDEAMGGGLPGLALASCRHETQYSRLFRS